MADERSYANGRFVLDVDGWRVGFVKKVSGWAMEADVVSHDMGPSNIQKKNVANIKWTPLKCTFGIGMGKGMADWIKAAFDMSFLTKTATLTSGDFNYKAMSEVTGTGGLITSFTCPKLEGSSKDAAYFELESEWETVRYAKPAPNDIRGDIAPKQKAWLCSNFRVEIGNLPTNRVSSVDSWTWKCGVVADQIGTNREATKHPTKLTVPDIKLTISSADQKPWQEFAKKWFIDGHHLEGDELNGRIVFLDPNMKDELGEVVLHNVV